MDIIIKRIMPKFSKVEWFGLIIIVGLAGFLRLYNLNKTMMFLGDQGRDALIVAKIVRDQDIALIGPVTSVGNMYLGPFYYYFMAPWLWLSYPSPVGPAYGVAIVNIISVILLFIMANKIFGKEVAFLSSLFYAIMPVAVEYSRFSWNPNLAAPIAVLWFWGLCAWWNNPSWKSIAGTTLAFGILIQLHYVALVLIVPMAIVYISRLIIWKMTFKEAGSNLGVFLLTLAITFVPLIAFDFRQNHILSERFFEFFTSNEKHVGVDFKETTLLQMISDRFDLVFNQITSSFLIWIEYQYRTWITMLSLLIMGGVLFWKKIKLSAEKWILALTLGSASLGIVFYSHTIFKHYLTFLLPIVAIFWAIVLNRIIKSKLLILGILILSLMLTKQVAGLMSMKWTDQGLGYYQEIVNQTLPKISQPYNVALVSTNHDYQAMNYRYFFNVSKLPPNDSSDYKNLNYLVVIKEENADVNIEEVTKQLWAPKYPRLIDQFTIKNGIKVEIYQR